MIESGSGRDLSRLVVPRAGGLVATGDEREPYRLIDPAGLVVEPVSVFLRELLAMGRSAATLRSYGMDLLRWWRFLRRGGSRLGSRVAGGGPRLQLLDRADGQAAAADVAASGGAVVQRGAGRAEPGDRQTRQRVTGTRRRASRTARRCCAGSTTSIVMRGSGPIAEPVPAGSGPPLAAGACAPQPDATRGGRSGWAATGRRCRGGSRARSPTSGSTSCSPRCRRTGTGRWWRSGSPPGFERRSCSGCAAATCTRASS